MTVIATRHVLVTGGASGLGRGIALRCAEVGAAVTILDVDGGGAERAAAEAAALGAAQSAGLACDVSDRGQVAAVAGRVQAELGPVDILVNNAGVVGGKLLLELSDEEIERTCGVNQMALFWVTRAFLPAMVARDSGHVVTVASAAGLIGTPKETDYAATKFAAVGFTEALHFELRRIAPHVKTTVVTPFYIDTGMFEGVKTKVPLLLPILREADVVEAIVEAIRRDRRKVELPFMVRTLPAMRLLPSWAFDRLADAFGVTSNMDEFRGRPAAAPDDLSRDEVTQA